jgi:ATP-binding cassette subfamily B protein
MFALAIPGYLRSLFDTLESNTTFDTLLFAVFAVLGMGLLEAVMVLLRRWLVLTPGTHVEAGLRRALYAKLQDLEVAFHDKWPSGQLLSRASSDLSMIRRWLSFGLVLLVANLFTIVVGFTLLFSYNWLLASVFFVVMSPLWILGFRFEKEYHVIARMSQDQA